MRQPHAGGEKLFVDYAGDRAAVVIDRLTGEIREAWIFVAVLGASNFTYAEATWTQGLADWIGAHTRAFDAIGGVPRLVVPDGGKQASRSAEFAHLGKVRKVHKAHRPFVGLWLRRPCRFLPPRNGLRRSDIR
jgi:transposase